MRDIHCTVPEEIHERLSLAAHNRGTTMTQLVQDCISGLNPHYRPVTPPSIADRPRPRRSNNKFTVAEQCLILQEKIYGLLTIYQIAKLWHCNKSTIARVVNREVGYTQEIRPRKLPVSVAQCEEIRELLIDEWQSHKKIGKRFGISATTVFRIRNKQGVYRLYGQPKER